jgi:hypothetical protein
VYEKREGNTKKQREKATGEREIETKEEGEIKIHL